MPRFSTPLRRIVLVFAAVSLTGCRAPSELQQQLQAVADGTADTIHLEHTTVTDADLAVIAQHPGLRQLLIEQSRIEGPGLEHLSQLSQLEHLRIRGSPVDDQGLRIIAGLKRLKLLNLPQATFTDAGLAELKRVPDLELLRFGSPAVTDQGMDSIASLKRLRFLHLIDVPITDAGLDKLHGMTQLESLYLDGAQVTDEGIERLLKQLPVHFHIDQAHHDRDPRRHPHTVP